MIAVSIVYNKPELQELQSFAFRQFAGIPLMFAGTPDAVCKVDFQIPAVELKWPLIFLYQVGQIVERFPDQDLLIVEHDIKPIAPVYFNEWNGYILRQWSSFAWPGILYRDAGRKVFPFWEQIGKISAVNIGKSICDYDTLLPFSRNDDGTETIGGVFLHETRKGRGQHVSPDPAQRRRVLLCGSCDADGVECYVQSVKRCERRRILKSGSRPCPRGKW